MGIGYLTPNSIPADTICRVLFIPNNEEFIANVSGALASLLDPHQWTQFGTLTPDQAANALIDTIYDFLDNRGVCRVIGEIIPYGGATSPDARWLLCDGSSYLRADYPDLFIVIGANFGAVDGTHFNVPDLQGRVPVGSGTGSGLTPRAIGDNFGEETHTLTSSEAPSHTHIDAGHTHLEGIAAPTAITIGAGIPAPSAIPAVGVSGYSSANIGSSGGGGDHNNIQPSLVINYLIVALS